jgi:Fur family ferric uptake transcriptional regulator
MTDGRSPAALTTLLAARGIRLTRPRRIVLALLATARRPLSVAEIHARLGDGHVNVASVYRTVALLCRLDIVQPVAGTGGIQRVELSERLTRHHHHLVCRRCGGVQDFDGCVLGKQVLARLEQRVRRATRFEPTSHDIRLYGICRQCATA